MTDQALTEAIGQRIRRLAQDAGYSTNALALRAGLPVTRVLDVIDGRLSPCPRTLRALARALNTTPSALIPTGLDD